MEDAVDPHISGPQLPNYPAYASGTQLASCVTYASDATPGNPAGLAFQLLLVSYNTCTLASKVKQLLPFYGKYSNKSLIISV